MKNKLTLIVFAMLLLVGQSFGQGATASLGNKVPTPGTQFSIPLTVSNFNNIGAITFIIKFDPDFVTPNYANLLDNKAIEGLTGNVVAVDQIKILYYATSGTFTQTTDKLCDINFATSCGPNSSALEFLTGCEVVEGLPPSHTIISVVYTNGTIGSNNVTVTLPKAEIGTVSCNPVVPNTTVSVPIAFSQFSTGQNVASIDIKVQYDPTLLMYSTVTGTGFLGTDIVANATNGNIHIIWTNTTTGGVDINGNKFYLNFIYREGNLANLNFKPCCLIGLPLVGSSTTGDYILTNFVDGKVIVPPSSSSANLGSKLDAIPGGECEIPLWFAGLPVGAAGVGVGAVDINIRWEDPTIVFTGIVTSTLSENPEITWQQTSSSSIHLIWTDPNQSGPKNINSTEFNPFLKLKFIYQGVDPAAISFGTGCSFSTVTGTTWNPVVVNYNNGLIKPGTATATASIGCEVKSIPGEEVLLPVTFTGLPANMGAVFLKITYDNDKLTFIDGQSGTLTSVTVMHDPVIANMINVIWTCPGTTTQDINGLFVNLRFSYKGSGGGSNIARVNFAQGCELTKLTGTTVSVVPANWVDGGVNIPYTITGIVKYDNDPFTNVLLGGVTILVQNGPHNWPLSGNVTPTTLYTTTSNADGSFSVEVLNGTYYLYATTSAAHLGLGGMDAQQLRAYFAGVYPNSLCTTNTVCDVLRLHAADVDQNGAVQPVDVQIIRAAVSSGSLTITGWNIPNWIFTNPQVTVSCGDVNIETMTPDSKLRGTCSGDLDGSYPTPGL